MYFHGIPFYSMKEKIRTNYFICCTLFMSILLSSFLLTVVDGFSPDDAADTFSIYDCNGDGVITKSDVDAFLKSDYAINFDKEILRNGMMYALGQHGGKMDIDQFTKFVDIENSQRSVLDILKHRFPNKQSISCDDLKEFLKLEDNEKDILCTQQEYTLEEAAKFIGLYSGVNNVG